MKALRETYIPPKLIMPSITSLRRRLVFKVNKVGNGNIKIITSVVIFYSLVNNLKSKKPCTESSYKRGRKKV